MPTSRHHILVFLILAASLAGLGAIASPSRSAPVLAPAAPRAAAAEEFEIDLAHSTLNYRLRHFGVSWFFGRINKPTGAFLLDAANPAASRLTVTAEVKNMDAGDDARNKFLLSPDFFNGREFRTLEFKSTAVKKVSDTAWEAAGNFTLRGVTKPITVRLDEYTELKTMKFGYRAGFLCTFTIKRSEYGMTMNVSDGMLGDEVHITASIEGVHE